MEFQGEEFSSFHGFCSAQSAEDRLSQTRNDSYLIRKNQQEDFLITYKDSRGKYKHIFIPKTRRNSILSKNPHLLNTNHIINHILNKCSLLLAYEVTFENQIPDFDTPLSEHSCNACNKALPSAKELRDHVDNNHRIRQCSRCEAVVLPSQEKSHRESCNAGATIFCQYENCNYSTKITRYMLVHNKSHEKKTLNCQLCPKQFSKEEALEAHVRNKHGKESPLPCQHCEMTFTTERARKSHIKHLHVFYQDGSVSLRCRECENVFETMLELNEHKLTSHSKKIVGPHSCPECNKVFSSRKLLKKHIRRKCCNKHYVATEEVVIGFRQVGVSNKKALEMCEPLKKHNGKNSIQPGVKKKLSLYSNSFNYEVKSEIVWDGRKENPRKTVIAYLRRPIHVILWLINERRILSPLLSIAIDYGKFFVSSSSKISAFFV